jgi:hypothetical protein
MVSFQTKNPNLGKFWRALEWKILEYFKVIGIFYGHLEYFTVIGIFYGHWNILESFEIFYGHLAYFIAIWQCCCNLAYFFKNNLATLETFRRKIKSHFFISSE